MKTCLAAFLIACSLPGFAQDGWKKPDTITAKVAIRTGGGLQKSFEVSRKGDLIRYMTTIPIGGELDGVPRIEVVSPAGVYTWLNGNPKTALRLPVPSVFEAVDSLAVPAFSRADLEFHLKGIEKALDKRVIPGKEEKVAGRDCLVLNVLDRPDSMNQDYQKLWIDKETGIAMRQEDYFGGTLTYSRTITELDLRTKMDESAFKPAADAVIIRGVVSAATLMNVHALKGGEEFKADIANINAKVKAPETKWAVAFDPASPFGYAQTNFREFSLSAMPSSNSNANNQRAQNQNRRREMRLARQAANGMIMQMYSAGGSDNLVFAPSTPATGDAVAGTFQIVIDDGSGQREFVLNSDGSVIRSQTQGETGSGQQNQAEGNKPTLTAKSDFVDPKTGETVTFCQTKNGSPLGAYAYFILGQPKPMKTNALSECSAYEASVPYKLNVVTWRKGDVRYSLGSTNLGVDELIAIAAKIK